MVCTIITDASYSPQNNSAAYAFVIKSEKGEIIVSDKFKVDVGNQNLAEIMAIINAVYHLKHNLKWEVSKIIINTDSQTMVQIWQNMGHKKKEYNVLLRKLEDIIGEVPIEIKHCKAHTKSKKGIARYNDICDRLAKKEMRK